jgi:autoinducer 2-degrading protein
MAKYGKKASQKVERAMHERKRGTLRSGRSGKRVTSRKQAIAIGLSEARRAGGKVPKRGRGGKSRRQTRRSSSTRRTRRSAWNWTAGLEPGRSCRLVSFDYTFPVIVVHVLVHVKAEHVEAFKRATVENARASVKEPGIARFDVVQQADDPTRFVLVEVYRTSDAPAAHKDTAHYQRWRDMVADMMAAPRTSQKFSNVFPDDADW